MWGSGGMGSRGVGELPCGGVVVWRSYDDGELQCGGVGVWGGVAVRGSCGVGQ